MELQRMFWFFIVLAFAIGATGVLQAAINNQVRLISGDAYRAALLSTSVSTLSLLAVSLVYKKGALFDGNVIGRMQWWMWTAGIIGAVFVAASALLVARLGAAVLFTLVVAGQLTGAVIMDHYGLLGLEKHPLTGPRALGIALVFGGVVLVRKY